MTSWLIGTLLMGISAAIATTFDDNVYLTAFFGKVNRHFRPSHVVIGEFVGFTALVLASLPGFFGGRVLPSEWVGLLGVMPIAIGMMNLLQREDNGLAVQTVSDGSGQPGSLHTANRTIAAIQYQKYPQRSLWDILRDRQTYKVSAVTIANGGNNIGIYVPLFASADLPSLSVILLTCYGAVGLWCILSYMLTRNPLMAPVLARYGQRIFPFILIWLGCSILMKSESYRLLAIWF